MFKQKKGINLSYDEQGLVYFVCKNEKKLSETTQKAILDTAQRVADEDYKPLYLLLTGKRELAKVSEEYYMTEKRLARLRERFYIEFIEILREL